MTLYDWIANAIIFGFYVPFLGVLSVMTWDVWRAESRAMARSRANHPTALILCGDCSPSLDDWAEWADADEITPANRIRCGRCGQ